MLQFRQVREAAAAANVVKVSLSAWDHLSYGRMNRPHKQLQFDQLVAGQKDFRAQFKGQLWMEVFLLAGMNSMPADVAKIADHAQEIGLDHAKSMALLVNSGIQDPIRAQ